MKPKQSDADRETRAFYERLIKCYPAEAISRTLNLFYRQLDEDDEIPTLAEFLAAFERVAANSIGDGLMLN